MAHKKDSYSVLYLFKKVEEKVGSSDAGRIASEIDVFVKESNPELVSKDFIFQKELKKGKELIKDQWYSKKKVVVEESLGKDIGVYQRYLDLLAVYIGEPDFDSFQKTHWNEIEMLKGETIKKDLFSSEKKAPLLDRYDLKARTLPTIFSLAPGFGLVCFWIVNINGGLNILEITLMASLLGIIIWAGKFMTMTMSKFFENLYFPGNKKEGFPTTTFLLFGNSLYSRQRKVAIRRRFLTVFGEELPTEEEEKDSNKESVSRLEEANDLMRLFVDSGKLVLKQNIKYGFTRNLIGGSLYGIVFSVIGIFLGIMWNSHFVIIAYSIGFCLFSIILFLRRQLLQTAAKDYAIQLHSEFLASVIKNSSNMDS